MDSSAFFGVVCVSPLQSSSESPAQKHKKTDLTLNPEP